MSTPTLTKSPATKNGKPKKESKMDKARVIYKAMKNKPRQEILTAFMKMGLTKHGANTYYYIVKKS